MKLIPWLKPRRADTSSAPTDRSCADAESVEARPAYAPQRPASSIPHPIHSTTVIGVRKDGQVALASDGQITVQDTIMKQTAKKVQKVYHGKILAGYAGTAADALTLFERFEGKLEETRGNLQRAVQLLVQDWRTDRVLRHLEALLLVANNDAMFVVSGQGDVIGIEEDVAAIGSGGPFALAAGKALARHSNLSAEQIAREAVLTAASICIYTNAEITLLTL